MQESNLGRIVKHEIGKVCHSQKLAASKIGVKQPTLNQICNKGVRPTPDSLNALTHYDKWHDAQTNIRILIAHLRDEINRAGHDAETTLDIRMQNGVRATTQVQTDLEILRTHMSDRDVAAIIHDIAALIIRAETATVALDRAAEAPGDPYVAKK